MKTHISVLAVVALMGAGPAVRAFAQHPAMPPGMSHDEHLALMKKEAELKKRGAEAMGFDQEKTTHHFRLTSTGGRIEVDVNDRADEASRSQVRAHLEEIAAAFVSGDFAKPFATHGEVPPGARTMQARRHAIVYQYEDVPDGGRVRITTADPQARAAVHEFLRYQIREHATGDPLAVAK